MRYLIFIFGVVTLACTQNEKREWLTNESPAQPHLFTIDENKDTTLVAPKGTILKIQAGSFETSAGAAAGGNVELRIQEFYTKEDFIYNRLSTLTTDGKLLQSSGMVYVEATSGTDTLRLKKDSPMTIMFPRKVNARTANLFGGEEAPNGEVQWNLLAPVHNDTIVARTLKPPAGEGDAAYEEAFKFVIGKDTIELTAENYGDFEKVLKRLPRNNDVYAKIPNAQVYDQETSYPYYVFKTTNLRYVNCDFFVDLELHDFTITLDNTNSDVFIVLDSLNSVLYPKGLAEKTNDYVFAIPHTLQASIVAYRRDNDVYYLGIERIKSGASSLRLKQIEKPLDEIRKEIERLVNTPR